MVFSIYIIISLLGATLLGFGFAWYLMLTNNRQLKEENEEITLELNHANEDISRLRTEVEIRQLSVDNLQRLLQTIENQVFELEHENNALKQDLHQLKEKIKQLENRLNNYNEVEVIREVPVLNENRKNGNSEDKNDSIRLLTAFRQGINENNGKKQPPDAQD